jgi:hypothetical protein
MEPQKYSYTGVSTSQTTAKIKLREKITKTVQ